MSSHLAQVGATDAGNGELAARIGDFPDAGNWILLSTEACQTQVRKVRVGNRVIAVCGDRRHRGPHPLDSPFPPGTINSVPEKSRLLSL